MHSKRGQILPIVAFRWSPCSASRRSRSTSGTPTTRSASSRARWTPPRSQARRISQLDLAQRRRLRTSGRQQPRISRPSLHLPGEMHRHGHRRHGLRGGRRTRTSSTSTAPRARTPGSPGCSASSTSRLCACKRLQPVLIHARGHRGRHRPYGLDVPPRRYRHERRQGGRADDAEVSTRPTRRSAWWPSRRSRRPRRAHATRPTTANHRPPGSLPTFRRSTPAATTATTPTTATTRRGAGISPTRSTATTRTARASPCGLRALYPHALGQ